MKRGIIIMAYMNREEIIREYATNQHEEEYISNLDEFPLDSLKTIIEYGEESFTLQKGMTAILTDHLFYYDFQTRDKIEQQYGEDVYTLVHDTNADWYISMDDSGSVSATISMSKEHYIIMSMLGTLEDMMGAIINNGVADYIRITDLDRNELASQ